MPALLERVGDVLEGNMPAPWLSSLLSHGLKSDTKHAHVPESSEYWQDHGSRAGTPFESDSSDSDCSSDSGDDPSSLFGVAANPSSTGLKPLFSKDVFRFEWEGIESIGESNALGLEFVSKGPVLEAQAVATSTPQAESLRAPPDHQDARSCDRPNYKHQAHLVPQPDSPADETLAGGRPQDIGLQDEVSDAPGLNKFQACQRVDDLKNWSNAGYPDQLEAAAAADWVRTYTANAPPCDWELLRAPRMRPIQLPGEEEEEEGGDDLLYSGPGLDGWLHGTFDGVPKTITLGGLDFALPVPFSTEF